MKATFNEFSYGFAFIKGFLASHPRVRAAPLLPDLRTEGRVGGFDVALDYPGQPVFFQFKVSEALVRSNALFWGQYGRPYFSFDVMNLKRSRQHNLLRHLSRREPFVFYAAPLFIELSDFNNYYLTNDVANHSLLVRVSRLPDLIDTDQHRITSATAHFQISKVTRPTSSSFTTSDSCLRPSTASRCSCCNKPRLHDVAQRLTRRRLAIPASSRRPAVGPSARRACSAAA